MDMRIGFWPVAVCSVLECSCGPGARPGMCAHIYVNMGQHMVMFDTTTRMFRSAGVKYMSPSSYVRSRALSQVKMHVHTSCRLPMLLRDYAPPSLMLQRAHARLCVLSWPPGGGLRHRTPHGPGPGEACSDCAGEVLPGGVRSTLAHE